MFVIVGKQQKLKDPAWMFSAWMDDLAVLQVTEYSIQSGKILGMYY